MSSTHKPRRRNKRGTTPDDSSPAPPSSSNALSKSLGQGPTFPLLAFFWSAKRSSQWVLLPIILMVVGLFRWAAGLWGYSGFQSPPMHGDFEAQRHWMEITQHLPISQWYFYDLQYWGLDYPPLTAYHSWLLGRLGSMLNPAWFALDASRRFESADLKIYMRATVLVSEYITYVPAVIIFNRRWSQIAGLGPWESAVALTAILMQPATILIDHAHFQYNTVMLGWFVASASFMLTGRYLWACVYFVASLCFKQMALYFAPAVFAYLLGVCVQPRINISRFTSIALVTVVSFALMFAPLLLGAEYDYVRNQKVIKNLEPPYLYMLIVSSIPWKLSPNSFLYPPLLQLSQAVFRIFPLARGLFEDKVANVWCAIHTVYKLNYLPIPFLSRLSLLATLGSIFPACLIIFLMPKRTLLPYAFASCAWGFFLFSFQVHEKSVLLPLLPMTLLIGGKGGLAAEIRSWVGFANLLGSWTMFPLLKRDELRVPYVVLNLLWAYLLGLPPTSMSLYTKPGISIPVKTLHLTFYTAMLVWHAAEATLPPPTRKPDLWVVLNCIIGAAGFGILYLWSTWHLLQKSGLLAWIQRKERQVAEADVDGDRELKAKKSS